ncbi:unnamed protein product [Pylaiella littoralis]
MNSGLQVRYSKTPASAKDTQGQADDERGRAARKPRDSYYHEHSLLQMACCLICVDDGPVPGSKLDNYYENPNRFQIGMMEAPCENCPWFTFGCVCMCCAQYIVRKRALDGNLANYVCCQGYMPSESFGACVGFCRGLPVTPWNPVLGPWRAQRETRSSNTQNAQTHSRTDTRTHVHAYTHEIVGNAKIVGTTVFSQELLHGMSAAVPMKKAYSSFGAIVFPPRSAFGRPARRPYHFFFFKCVRIRVR